MLSTRTAQYVVGQNWETWDLSVFCRTNGEDQGEFMFYYLIGKMSIVDVSADEYDTNWIGLLTDGYLRIHGRDVRQNTGGLWQVNGIINHYVQARSLRFHCSRSSKPPTTPSGSEEETANEE